MILYGLILLNVYFEKNNSRIKSVEKKTSVSRITREETIKE